MKKTDAIIIDHPKGYDFEPRDDITPLEAAWLAHFFASLGMLRSIKSHIAWDIIQRHFVEIQHGED